jgi:hypothetical protein
MKTTLTPLSKVALLCTAVCAAMFAFSQNANALTIGDGQTLGYVFYGIPSGDADRTQYVNDLVYFYNHGCGSNTDCGTADGQDYFMVNGAPTFGATLPGAVWAANGTGTSINLGAVGTYTYLFAKYDGPNQGSVVWYVGNLGGTQSIPDTWNGYGLSGWTLFTGGNPPTSLPDGGATVMLLGTALAALGMVRRFLMG